MTARAPAPPTRGSMDSSLDLGSKLIVLAGIGLVGYGLMFLIRNFTGFIELGLTPQHIGGTPEQLRAANPQFFYYTGHLQVAVAAFIIALGVAVIPLAWRGVRTGQRWALWTAFLAPVIGVGIALPLHYIHGFATLGHLGLIYLDAAILLVGTVLAYKGMDRRTVASAR
jgi:predicted small integral membrane protein